MTGYKWTPTKLKQLKDVVPAIEANDGNACRFVFAGDNYVFNIGDSGGGSVSVPTPTDFAVVAYDYSTNVLTWNTPSAVDGFILDRSADGETWYNDVVRMTGNSDSYSQVDGASTLYDDYSQAEDIGVFYRVRAFIRETETNVEHYSDKASAEISDYSALAVPDLTAQDDYQYAKLSWSFVQVNVNIEESSDDGATWEVIDTAAHDTNYKFINHTSGDYKYRIRAQGNDNYPYSNVVSATFTDAPAITDPSDAVISATSATILHLEWTNNDTETFLIPFVGDGSDIDGLSVSFRNNDGTVSNEVIDPTRTSIDYAGNPETDYHFSIRLVRGGLFGNEVTSNTVTTPIAQPTVTGSRDGNDALASLLTALAGLNIIIDESSA